MLPRSCSSPRVGRLSVAARRPLRSQQRRTAPFGLRHRVRPALRPRPSPRRRLSGASTIDHVPPVEPRLRLDLGALADRLGDPVQDALAELGVEDLAAAEHDRDLDLVTLVEELGDQARLGVEVPRPDLRPVLHLLDAAALGLAPRLLGLLGLVELELPVVHDPAHGRVRRRRHLDEVEVHGPSELRARPSSTGFPAAVPPGSTSRTCSTRMRSLIRRSGVGVCDRALLVLRATRVGGPLWRSRAVRIGTRRTSVAVAGWKPTEQLRFVRTASNASRRGSAVVRPASDPTVLTSAMPRVARRWPRHHHDRDAAPDVDGRGSRRPAAVGVEADRVRRRRGGPRRDPRVGVEARRRSPGTPRAGRAASLQAAVARAAGPSRRRPRAASRPLFVSSGAERSSAWPTVLAGEHAEDHRHARGDAHLLDPPRALPRHDVVVAGLAPDDRAEADHRGVARLGGGERRVRTAGSSKAPGTHATVTSAASTPRSASPARHPSSSRIVIAPLNRAHATPTRSPRPSPSPSRSRPDRAARSARRPRGRARSHPTTPSSPSRRWPMRSRLVRR